jgi:hypothetical protein
LLTHSQSDLAAWLSWLERLVHIEEVTGSNPVAATKLNCIYIMLITAHGLAGALIGKEAGYPPLAFLLGLVSHFVLDSIPHCDGPDDVAGKDESSLTSKTQYVLIVVDLLLFVFVLLIVYFFNSDLFNNGMIWGIAGALLPDLIDNVPMWKKKSPCPAETKEFS